MLYAQVKPPAKVSYKALAKAYQALQEGQDANAEHIIQKILANPKTTDETRAYANRLLAQLYAAHARKDRQIEHLYKSYWLFKESPNRQEETEALCLLAGYYLQMDLPDKATKYLQRAQLLAAQEADVPHQIEIQYYQARLAILQDSLSRAKALLQQAIHLSEETGLPHTSPDNLCLLASVCGQLGDPKAQLAYMKEAASFTVPPDTLAFIYTNLGVAYMANAWYDSADLYLQQALNLLQHSNNSQHKISVYEQLAALRTEQHQTDEAITYLQQAHELQRTLFTEDLKQEISYAASRYHNMVAETQLAQEREKNKVVLMGLVAGVVLLAAAGIIIVWLRRTNRIIVRQKDEIRNTHQQLLQKEILYSQLFDNSPGLISVHSMDGMIMSANQATEMLLKVEKGGLAGRSVRDFVHPAYTEQFDEFLTQLSKRTQQTGWMRVVDGDGHTHILSYQNTVVKPHDAPAYVIGFAQDQTEMFKARMETEQERKRLLSVMENVPDLFAIVNPEGNVLYVNRSHFHTQPLVNQDISLLFPSERPLIAHIHTVIDTQQLLQIEEQVNERFVSAKLVPIVKSDQVVEVLIIITDITDLKRRREMEQELNQKIERSEQRYRHLVEESRVLICTHTLTGDLLNINKPGAAMVAYDVDSLVGKNLKALLPAEYHANYEQYLQQICEERVVEGFMTIITRKEQRLVLLFRNILITEPGQEPHILATAQDVTEWKKAEYRERQARLELQEAKEAAEESNRLKTIFLGSLSHEVRTPLQAIIGLSEILETPAISLPKRQQYLNFIKQRAEDMQDIIDSLLDMASIETGELKSFPVVTNLSELVTAFVGKQQQSMQLTGTSSVQLELDNQLPPDTTVLLDPVHVQQVLSNLVRNGLKFTEQGTVTVRCYPIENACLIEVIDTGIGISSDMLEQIFKPFRQAHEGLSRSKGGIGLGLSICKKMIDMWHGELRVKSTPGVGSTFSFTIPV